jgi:hypothetical protein
MYAGVDGCSMDQGLSTADSSCVAVSVSCCGIFDLARRDESPLAIFVVAFL